MDPNGAGVPSWTPHNFPANKNMLRLKPGEVAVMQDDFREDRMAVFNDPALAGNLQI